MSRYKREDYENLDEYEDEEREEEGVGEGEYEEYEEEAPPQGEYEEYEEEAPPQPTQQELEYLELRKQLKDTIRNQMKKENSSSLGHSQERKKKLPYDNYGSFFGPSQPVIAPRVIQESMSLLENERLTAKVPKPNHSNKISGSSSSNGGSKNQILNSRPKVVNELKNKVQKIKVTRDYSFLLSDDAELPAPTKDPPQNVSGGPPSDARSAQVPPKNKQLFNSNGRQVSNGNRPVQNRGRPVHDGVRQVSNGSRQLSNGHEKKKNAPSAGHLHPRVAPNRLNSPSKPISRPVDSRKLLANSNGSGPGRPLAPKPLPSRVPSSAIQKRKLPSTGSKSLEDSVRKLSSTKLQASASKQPLVSKQSSVQKQPLEQRKGYQDPSKGKILSKQPVASSKPQISKPSTKVPSQPTFQKDRLKKKPPRPYSDDEDDLGGGSGVTSMIQKLMGYNPKKYRGHDSDDSDMEANFDDILREEKRSAKIARMEDEEELRKIEEEERREMLRKEAKKRKLSHR